MVSLASDELIYYLNGGDDEELVFISRQCPG